MNYKIPYFSVSELSVYMILDIKENINPQGKIKKEERKIFKDRKYLNYYEV